jgi:hypothetical protein
MTRLAAFFPATSRPDGPDVLRRVFVRRADARKVASMIDPSKDFDLDLTGIDVASLGFLSELLSLRPRVRFVGYMNEDVAECVALVREIEEEEETS